MATEPQKSILFRKRTCDTSLLCFRSNMGQDLNMAFQPTVAVGWDDRL